VINFIIVGSAALCIVGCFIAFLFGRLTRNSGIPKFLRALMASTLFSWVFAVGGHGGVAALPAYLIIFYAPKTFARRFDNDDIALFVSAIFVSIIVFLGYWLAARIEPTKRISK
jgi:MFS superfamily sulfate permease-like transporter